METTESNSLLGYGKPPWVFKGSALYQLHLVKAETARAIIPKEFKLVEAFGYTLGGFFLANYEDSPAGVFDELVVIAGIVWNPPTSCAWAARVLVSSDKACVHGREDVGLPSQVATFTKRVSAIPMTKKSRFGNFLHKIGIINDYSPGVGGYQKRSTTGNGMMIDIQVKEMMSNHTSTDICSINLNNTPAPKWIGPAVKLPLPSFSGRTEYNPHLLKYSCQIECRLRAVPPAKVSGPSPLAMPMHDEVVVTSEYNGSETTDFTNSNYKRELSISVMLSKPILALEFNSLKMEKNNTISRYSEFCRESPAFQKCLKQDK
ncbi:hypothetical protein ACJIZ3_010480 [Penstemon smallii]|uniref:Protein NEOXANTHIN-DEFICIENT 1 n=1 Tax=Penstemon smallii TaxID=265156 RepID=A0ABD3TFF0_9LAMI